MHANINYNYVPVGMSGCTKNKDVPGNCGLVFSTQDVIEFCLFFSLSRLNSLDAFFKDVTIAPYKIIVSKITVITKHFQQEGLVKIQKWILC